MSINLKPYRKVIVLLIKAILFIYEKIVFFIFYLVVKKWIYEKSFFEENPFHSFGQKYFPFQNE